MPDYAAFLKGFGIKKGIIVDNYKLNEIHITHNVIQQYRQYEYHITLIFDGQGDDNKLLLNLKNYVKGNRIIYSKYGNPYNCNFGILKLHKSNENHVIIQSIGTAIRVFH